MSFFLFKIYLFYVCVSLQLFKKEKKSFLTVLGLGCCVQLSLVVASRGYSLLQCVGFSLQWLLFLRSMGSRAHGAQ